jgi:hypothetical protein
LSQGRSADRFTPFVQRLDTAAAEHRKSTISSNTRSTTLFRDFSRVLFFFSARERRPSHRP